MANHPEFERKKRTNRVSATISKERGKGTKPKKAIAIGLSTERQRKKKLRKKGRDVIQGATFE